MKIPEFIRKSFLRIADQKTVLVLVSAAFLAECVPLFYCCPVPRDETVFPARSFWMSRRERLERQRGREEGTFRIPARFSPNYRLTVDLNKADLDELRLLPAVGPEIGERIIAYRVLNEGFRSSEELMNVKGIGEKSFKKIEPYLSEIDPLLYPERIDGDQILVDLNYAGKEDLCRIPGVGPVLAERIILYRAENGPFAVNEDLMKVRGIGPDTFKKIKPYLKEIVTAEY